MRKYVIIYMNEVLKRARHIADAGYRKGSIENNKAAMAICRMLVDERFMKYIKRRNSDAVTLEVYMNCQSIMNYMDQDFFIDPKYDYGGLEGALGRLAGEEGM